MVGGAGFGLVEADVLPGRAWVNSHLGLDGGAGVIPDIASGPITSGTYESAARQKTVGWTLLRPPGQDGPLPVAVALHGRGGTNHSVITTFCDKFLASAMAEGVPPFAIVGVDGDETYWHARQMPESSGKSGVDDPAKMITDEILPLLGEQGLLVDRVAFTGWSMGGYGSLLLAERMRAERVAAVCAISPAVFLDFPSSSPGSFDSAEDFAANDVFDELGGLAGIDIQLQCGTDDPFDKATERLFDSIKPRPSGGLSAGGHTDAFATRHGPVQMRFLGEALAR